MYPLIVYGAPPCTPLVSMALFLGPLSVCGAPPRSFIKYLRRSSPYPIPLVSPYTPPLVSMEYSSLPFSIIGAPPFPL